MPVDADAAAIALEAADAAQHRVEAARVSALSRRSAGGRGGSSRAGRRADRGLEEPLADGCAPFRGGHDTAPRRRPGPARPGPGQRPGRGRRPGSRSDPQSTPSRNASMAAAAAWLAAWSLRRGRIEPDGSRRRTPAPEGRASGRPERAAARSVTVTMASTAVAPGREEPFWKLSASNHPISALRDVDHRHGHVVRSAAAEGASRGAPGDVVDGGPAAATSGRPARPGRGVRSTGRRCRARARPGRPGSAPPVSTPSGASSPSHRVIVWARDRAPPPPAARRCELLRGQEWSMVSCARLIVVEPVGPAVADPADRDRRTVPTVATTVQAGAPRPDTASQAPPPRRRRARARPSSPRARGGRRRRTPARKYRPAMSAATAARCGAAETETPSQTTATAIAHRGRHEDGVLVAVVAQAAVGHAGDEPGVDLHVPRLAVATRPSGAPHDSQNSSSVIAGARGRRELRERGRGDQGHQDVLGRTGLARSTAPRARPRCRPGEPGSGTPARGPAGGRARSAARRRRRVARGPVAPRVQGALEHAGREVARRTRSVEHLFDQRAASYEVGGGVRSGAVEEQRGLRHQRVGVGARGVEHPVVGGDGADRSPSARRHRASPNAAVVNDGSVRATMSYQPAAGSGRRPSPRKGQRQLRGQLAGQGAVGVVRTRRGPGRRRRRERRKPRYHVARPGRAGAGDAVEHGERVGARSRWISARANQRSRLDRGPAADRADG